MKAKAMMVPKVGGRRPIQAALVVLALAAATYGQSPLTREYIRFGDRTIAVENYAPAVSPSTVRLRALQTATFSVGFTPVVWTLSPTSNSGVINASGLYSAPATVPAETTVTVEARQSAGGPVVSTAKVVLEPSVLLVTPSTQALQASGSVQFSANMQATWSMTPATGAGTINGTTGLYQAPASIGSSQNVTVAATSTGNPAMSGTAAVTLLPAAGMCTVSPASLAWGPSGSGLTVNLTNCPVGYNWTASANGVAWVTLSAGSGSGNGSITVTAQALAGSTPRTGTILVDGAAVSVRQDPACTSTFGNPVLGSPQASVNGTVQCGTGVQWTSSTGGATWLQLQPASGTGSTSAQLVVNSYTGTGTRTATVTVAGNAFTVIQHPPCSVPQTTISLGGGTDSRTVALTCSTAAPWATSASPTWLHAAPASGTGGATLTISTDANGTGASRSGNVTVDGKSIPVTQSAATALALSATAVTLSHGQQYQFVATIGAVNVTSSVTWTVVSGLGSFTTPGLYLAPATIPPNSTAVIQARDVAGGGVASATVTLIAYAPPTSLTVSPASGSALSQTFTFAVTNPAGATLSVLDALISTSITQLQNACSIRVRSGYLIDVLENQGSAYTLPIIPGQSGSAENSQCRVLGSGSAVTVSGNVTSVQLQIQFKPGFIGQKVIGASTTNSTNFVTQMAQLGTWNLSANFAALPPSAAFTAPAANATVGGDVSITGWALDNTTRVENAITSVRVYIDNVLQTGVVTTGQSSTICTTYPERPGCPNVGWSYIWNSRLAANGTRTIKVAVTDGDNPAQTTEITRTVTVYNPPSTPITVQPASTFARMQLNGGYNPPYPQFTAYRGVNVLSPVNWSLNPSFWTYGSINSSGVYTPAGVGYNAAGTQVQVRATNPSDSNDYGTANAVLMGVLANGSYLLGLSPWQQVQFMTSLGNVNFTLSPNLGNITYYGVFTHNASGYTPGTIVTVTATQVGNSNNRETAYVQLW